MAQKGLHVQARLLCGAAIAALSVFSGAAVAQASPQPKALFDIEPQPLASALKEFSAQSKQSLLFTPELTDRLTTRGVMGAADVPSALSRVLEGTGLTYRLAGDTYLIVQAQRAPTKPVERFSTIAAETLTGSAVEGLVVTAQKRREQIQDVPIAISAFSADALQAQKIEGGFDLLKAIPNVTFSKNNFTGYNFSIRGIGTKAISATTDPGVAVAFNSTGLIQNRLFEQEYFDIERVEVLRGPQGTLYGRNATSGVINVITEKADLDAFDGSLKGEVGNFHTKRLSGFVNVPLIEDVLAVRFAGALTSRQGYDFNSGTNHAVNGRDLWSGRLSIGFEPTDAVRADFIWERFNEDDDRSRTGKQLCHRDPGQEVIGETSTVFGQNPVMRSIFSQGCKAGSLYDEDAFGTPNGLSLPFIVGMLVIGEGNNALFPIGYDPVTGAGVSLVRRADPYGGLKQSSDLRVINSFRDPVYRANADIFELNVDVSLSDALTFTSQTAYNKDEVYSFQDFNRFNTVPIFNDTASLWYIDGPSPWRNLAPGGLLCDPQVGCSKSLAAFDVSQGHSTQFSQEFRLQSDFDGPVNFSVGANYVRFSTLIDYYVMYNLITALAQMPPFNFGNRSFPDPGFYNPIDPTICNQTINDGGNFIDGPVDTATTPNAACPYIDPNPIENINGEGHNYFRSKNPYRLVSWAGFGEAYWQVSDAVKVTAGLRYTDDTKTFTPVPSQILLSRGLPGGNVNKGYPAKPDIKQNWGEFTGRVGLDWKPDLSFTDETMLYAFYSRGYKGGGANPPTPGFATAEEIEISFGLPPGTGFPILELTAVDYGPTFDPEFVNAYEVGAKNTLFGGGLVFNAGAFYYDYKDYQVSQIKDRTAVNENFDAKIWGLEFESTFALSDDLQIIANLGYLDTEIADGETSIDLMNRTQGDPNYVVTKGWAQLPSNCVVPAAVAESYLQARFEDPAGGGIPRIRGYWLLCGGWALGAEPIIDPATGEPYDKANYPELNGGAGIRAQLGGNELPNSPHWTVNIGAQYGWDLLGGEWRATVRGDAYWQGQSWARVYNLDQYDKLHGWYNTNLSFWIEKPEDDLKIEFYVKNILDDTPITDSFLNSDDTALTTNVFTLDPRLIGLQITKGF